MQFTKTGKGLPVQGPDSLKQTPNEFTVSFWVYPTDIDTASYFLNLFNRAFIWGEKATMYIFYKFMTSLSTNT